MSGRTTAPVPVTGLPAGVHTGPLGARVVAQLIDAVVPVVLLTILLTADLPTGGVVVLVLLIVAWLLLVWSMVARRAASPGMRVMKLQIVGLRDGRPIGWGRFAVRELVLAALTVTVAGLLAMLFLLSKHPRKQGWHDLLAGSVVIKQRLLAPPLPRPAPGSKSLPRPTPTPTQVPEQKPPAPLTPPTSGSGRPEPQRVLARTAAGPSGSTRLQPPGATTVPAAPRTPPERLSEGWSAVLDDGRTVAVTGLVLLGRNPQGRPGEEDAELIKVTDEGRTVSKTHLAIGVDVNGVYVMDRGSTNGSTLTDDSGVSTSCYPGDLVPVPDGGIVSFGNHWLRLERSAGR